LEKETPVSLVFHEWNHIRKDLRQKGLSWKQKWMYLFGPPGWSHDGSRFTSNQLRQAEKENVISRHTKPS